METLSLSLEGPVTLTQTPLTIEVILYDTGGNVTSAWAAAML